MRKSCIHSISFWFCLSSFIATTMISGCSVLPRETRYDDNKIKYSTKRDPQTTTVYRSSPDGEKTRTGLNDNSRVYSSSPSVEKSTVGQYENATAYYNARQRGSSWPESDIVRVQEVSDPEMVEERVMVLEISDVLFDFDKAIIKVDYIPELDKWVDYFVNNPDASASIYGHADSTGPETYNLGLSEKRAQAVVKYLIDHGVPADRISAKGFGETKPVADNTTKEGRQKNRRVEMTY